MSNVDYVGRRAPHVVLGLIAITLLAVGTARLVGFQADAQTTGDIVTSCTLRFEDGPAGVVRVYDARHGALLSRFEAGKGSFVRGVLRSMTRERRSMDRGAEKPFLLSRHSDGALTIRDQATGRTIFLDAFGPDNAGVFAGMLDASLLAGALAES